MSGRARDYGRPWPCLAGKPETAPLRRTPTPHKNPSEPAQRAAITYVSVRPTSSNATAGRSRQPARESGQVRRAPPARSAEAGRRRRAATPAGAPNSPERFRSRPDRHYQRGAGTRVLKGMSDPTPSPRTRPEQPFPSTRTEAVEGRLTSSRTVGGEASGFRSLIMVVWWGTYLVQQSSTTGGSQVLRPIWSLNSSPQ